MKTPFLGLPWMFLLGFGYVVVVCMEPGYLDFDNLPDTNFSCVGKVIGGYYADLETNCQMFHVCTIGQLDEPMDIRFLCLNGTVFDQETRVCERIDEVDCSKSEQFYSLNLELYGNTQPSIPEDSETDPPIIIKASTTTTTTTQKPTTKTTRTPSTTTTKIITSHHFPVSGSSDIRFNPEEINISLNPGASPSLRSKTVAYQQVYNSDNKVAKTHTNYGAPPKEDFVRILPHTQRPLPSSTQQNKAATASDINYGFTYHQDEFTEPPHNYQYHFRNGPFRNQFKTTTHIVTTRKQQPTTFRTPFYSSLKPNFHTYQVQQTQKPQRLQLPLPLLPTLPPLTFSSPAPFSLGHHIETKRYTSDQPPRIIISASASVSDNSGRRLNYSLGTIGVTPLLEQPPKSYDEYKDHDVVLDPFYHDVPKIKTRKKRQAQNQNGDDAAIDVLRFLFNWYRNQQSSTIRVPIDAEDITEINQQLAPIVEKPIKSETDFKDSALFDRKSKFNIVGDVLSVTEKHNSSTHKTTDSIAKIDTSDYVDDNYEAVVQVAPTDDKNLTETEDLTTTEPTITTTTTEPTTTSRIAGIMKSRAKAHHKRIMNENRRKYTSSVTNLRPKIRRGRVRTSTTEIEPTSSTTLSTTLASTTLAPPTTTFQEETTTFKEEVLESTTVPINLSHEDSLESHSYEAMSVIPAPIEKEETESNVTTEKGDNEISKDQQREESRVGTNLHKEFDSNELDNYEDIKEEERNESTTKATQVETTTVLEETTQLILQNEVIKEEAMNDKIDNEEIDSTTKVSIKGATLYKINEEVVEQDKENTEVKNYEEATTEKVESTTEVPTTSTILNELNEEHIEQETVENTEENREILKNETPDNTQTTEVVVESTTLYEKSKDLEEKEISKNDVNEGKKNEEITTKTDFVVPESTTLYLHQEEENVGTTTKFEELTTLGTTDMTTEESSTTEHPKQETSTEELATVTNLTPAITTTTETPITRKSRRRRPRPSYRKPNPRHRFSTELTSKPRILTTSPSFVETSTSQEEEPATNAPLYKSVNPTQAETAKESLHTTPMYKLRRTFIFNCFGKPINKFYSDPRDCRLFHYCTSGYNKNQLLDMKFVCDLGTYFDDEKLICTKMKPERCL